MPIGSWGPNDRPLLSGLFGVFQNAAANHLDTASIWSSLRVAAATWQFQAQGGGDLPPVEQLEQTGADILRQQGIGINQVNAYRALAGQWRSARGNLAAADPSQQLDAQMIFQPPWASTAESAVPSRYRIRVNWDAQDATGNRFSTWGSYELTAPLTSIDDALAQASALVGRKPTSDMALGASVTGVNDFEIEQV